MIRNRFILVASALLIAICCKQEIPTDPDYVLTTPVLEVTQSQVTIVKYSNETATSFTWTSASDKLDVNYSLQYCLDATRDYKYLDMGEVRKFDFTYRELDALRASLGLEPETDFTINVYVEAATSSIVLPERSSVVQLNVAYDIPVPDPLELYGYGDAFKWGTDLSEAEQLETEDHNLFTWHGWLESGKGFKFVTNEALKEGGIYPAYGRDEKAADYWTLKEVVDEVDDQEFSVTQDGYYDLTLNVANKKITADYKGDGKLHLYGVGTGFDWGWTLAQAQEFATADDIIYTWTGDARGKGFKIMLSNTSWAEGYNWNKEADGGVAPTGDVTEWTAILRVDGGGVPDEYFTFPKDGNYTLSFNSQTLKLTMTYNGRRSDWEPEAYNMDGLYLYGPGIGGGKLADEIAMTTEDNDTYIYEDTIKANTNAFKLMCLKGKWWPAFVRDTEDSSKIAYHKTESEGDTYWGVETTGTYRVTVVLSDLSIKIECID